MPSPCSGPAVVSLGGQVTQIHHRPIILFCPTPAATTDLPGLPSSGVTTLEAGNSQLLSPLGAPSLDTNVTDNQPVDISLDLPEFMKPRNDVDEVIGSPVTSLNTSLDLIDVKSGAVGSSEAHSSPSVEVPKDVYCPTPSLINIMQLEDDTMPLEDEDIPLDDGSISLNDETLPLEPEEKIMADGMFCVDGDLASNPESLSSDCLTVSTSLSTPSVTSSDHTSTIEHSVTDFETSSQHAQPESPSPFSDLENTSVLPSLSEKLENQEGIAINPPQVSVLRHRFVNAPIQWEHPMSWVHSQNDPCILRPLLRTWIKFHPNMDIIHRVTNHMSGVKCEMKLLNPFPNSHSCTIEVCKWRSNKLIFNCCLHSRYLTFTIDKCGVSCIWRKFTLYIEKKKINNLLQFFSLYSCL